MGWGCMLQCSGHGVRLPDMAEVAWADYLHNRCLGVCRRLYLPAPAVPRPPARIDGFGGCAKVQIRWPRLIRVDQAARCDGAEGHEAEDERTPVVRQCLGDVLG